MAIFDNIATQYDSWYETKKGSFVDKVETQLAFRLLKMQNGMKVLDFGCGTGNFSIKLANKGCKVTGVDISEEMLRVAQAKTLAHKLDIDYVKIDANSLTLPDNTFDAAVSMATFEFIKNPLTVLSELFRVVKPGGWVLVGTIAQDSAWGKLYESEDYQNNSVFKNACFKTLQDLKEWERDKLIATGECLFIQPLADEDEYNFSRESELAGTRKGGFICALWRK